MPVSPEFIYLTKPWIGQEEKDEVMDTLNGMWLSRGPKVSRFEEDFKNYIGSKSAVAVSSCTAALHVGLVAAGIKKGDEVITTPMTFPATTNAILYERAKPILVDVSATTFNIDPSSIENKITEKTKAIIPVHLAGNPCDMLEINRLAEKYNLFVLEDAAHAVGGEYHGVKLGNVGNAGAFSFYASKNICTGDGGMLTVRDDEKLAEFARVISLHGMSSSAWKRYSKEGSPNWELIYPGFKYNMTDIEASLGIHQLKKVEKILQLREQWTELYNKLLEDVKEITPQFVLPNRRSSRHLYIISLDILSLGISRDEFMKKLREENIQTGIHFVSVHKQPYYQKTFGYQDSDFPIATYLSNRIVSLPLYPQMTEEEVKLVVEAVKKVISEHKK